MTKQTRTAEQILHEDYIQPWIDRLNLHRFHLHATLESEMDEEAEKHGAAAQVTTNPPYVSGHITVKEEWFESCLDGEHEEEIEFVLVHELCHLILYPIMSKAIEMVPARVWEEFDKAQEGLCDELTNIILKLHHREDRGLVKWNS